MQNLRTLFSRNYGRKNLMRGVLFDRAAERTTEKFGKCLAWFLLIISALMLARIGMQALKII